jgi:hypothetical protein
MYNLPLENPLRLMPIYPFARAAKDQGTCKSECHRELGHVHTEFVRGA